MACFVGAGITAIFACMLLIVCRALEKEANSFKKNMRSGKAEVVGYDRADQSNWYTLLVQIPELHDGQLYNCAAGKIDLSKYSKGAIIDVLYAPKKIAGIKIVEVQLCDNPPADKSRVGRGIKRVSIALLVVATALTIVGMICRVF